MKASLSIFFAGFEFPIPNACIDKAEVIASSPFNKTMEIQFSTGICPVVLKCEKLLFRVWDESKPDLACWQYKNALAAVKSLHAGAFVFGNLEGNPCVGLFPSDFNVLFQGNAKAKIEIDGLPKTLQFLDNQTLASFRNSELRKMSLALSSATSLLKSLEAGASPSELSLGNAFGAAFSIDAFVSTTCEGGTVEEVVTFLKEGEQNKIALASWKHHASLGSQVIYDAIDDTLEFLMVMDRVFELLSHRFAFSHSTKTV